MVQTEYFFDQAAAEELARLGGIAAMFDPASTRHLTALGVRPGRRCLEVGAGSGTIARWLAEQVGPGGHVVATDLDPRFLQDLDGVEVRQHDLLRDPLEPDAYDVVHARMVVEHLPDRAGAIARLVAALRPGGVLLLEDLNFGGPATTALEDGTTPAALAPMFTRINEAFAKGLGSVGADTHFGVRLPAALEAAGLDDVGAELTARLLHGGDPGSAFYVNCLGERANRLIAAGLLTREDADRSIALVRDPEASWFSLALVSAWGRRPAE
jgi:SAM-dependent methyltransferase